MMKLSSVFCRTLDAYQSGKYTIISNYGGTRSGKTYSTLQLLYLILISDNHSDLMVSVVSRSVPHLKRGVIRDFEAILDSNDRTGLVDVNKTDMIYTFKNNNRIEFFSADNAGKLHGAARDILYVNECNYINEEKIKQLFVRTTGVKFIDYNPSAQFWIDNYRSREDFIEFHSTYLDNEFLTKEQIREIESNKNNSRWWAIYGEGKEYLREGLCYPKVIFDKPKSHHFENPVYGLDFGYNDPTVMVRVEIDGNKLYVDMVFGSRGMDVTDIKTSIWRYCKKGCLIIADSSAPQIIHELKNAGIPVKPCVKGNNSVFEGVQLVNTFEIHCCEEPNSMLAKEFKSYAYEQDDDGNYLDTIEDKNNHCMDALRYIVQYLRGKNSGRYNYLMVK